MNTEVSGSTVEVSPEIIERAKAMGWVEEEHFKGKGKFVDAETFVRNGETRLPILNQRVEKLTGENARLKAEQEALKEEVKKVADAAFATAQAEYQAQLEILKSQRKTAIADGDGEAFEAAEAAIGQLKPPTPPKIETPSGDSGEESKGENATPAEIQSWMQANPWYSEDNPEALDIAQSQAILFAKQAARRGEKLVGLPLAQMVEAYMRENHADLVGGPPPSGHEPTTRRGMAPSSNGAKGYDALPADAKAACERMIAKNFIGRDIATGKQTPESIARAKASYATNYFQDEARRAQQ